MASVEEFTAGEPAHPASHTVDTLKAQKGLKAHEVGELDREMCRRWFASAVRPTHELVLQEWSDQLRAIPHSCVPALLQSKIVRWCWLKGERPDPPTAYELIRCFGKDLPAIARFESGRHDAAKRLVEFVRAQSKTYHYRVTKELNAVVEAQEEDKPAKLGDLVTTVYGLDPANELLSVVKNMRPNRRQVACMVEHILRTASLANDSSATGSSSPAFTARALFGGAAGASGAFPSTNGSPDPDSGTVHCATRMCSDQCTASPAGSAAPPHGEQLLGQAHSVVNCVKDDDKLEAEGQEMKDADELNRFVLRYAAPHTLSMRGTFFEPPLVTVLFRCSMIPGK